MLPLYLKLKGFRSYIDSEIDFSKLEGVTCISAINGAGKSSILEAITTCLFWQNSSSSANGVGMDEVINTTCDKFELEFCFEMNNVVYTIITIKERGEARKLTLLIDGVDVSEKVTTTQEKINDIIKMNYDTFLDTICLSQGQANRFMNKKPAERKETLTQILDIQKYEQYEKFAKEEKKRLKSKIDEINSVISSLQNEDINVEELEEQIHLLDKEIKDNNLLLEEKETVLQDILSKKAIYEQRKRQYETLLKTKTDLENKILSLKSNYNKLKETYGSIIVEDIEDTTNDLKEQQQVFANIVIECKENIATERAKISSLEEEIAKLQKKYNRLEKYNEAVCELCGNEITAEHKQKHLSLIQHDINECQSKKEVAENIILKQKQIGKENTIKYNDLETLIKNTLNKIKINNENKTRKESLKEKASIYKEQYVDLKQQLENIVIEKIEEENFNDYEVKLVINELKQSVLNKSSLKSSYLERINIYNENSLKIKGLKKELEKIKEEYSDYNSLVTTFGKNGIPAQIIEHDVPELELEVNRILDILSNNSLSVKFITSKSTAKGKSTVDTFDIIVNDIDGSRLYETYSGGEKFRIDFACHIGLSKFLTKRSGATIDFLMIDEGLGSQDDIAKQKFVESIYALKDVFKQILIITHIQDLQDCFDNKIFIAKDQLKGSVIEY